MKLTRGVVWLGALMSSLFGADLPASKPAEAADPMETVAGRAMTLIREGKFGEARALLLPAAEKGAVEAQALLGQVYQAGWGEPPDYVEALKWWSRAAAGGSTDAQWGLGLLYDEGKGVPRDSTKAAEWWKQAADHGNIKATVNLAFLYEEGRGVARNLKECARLFLIAAEAGEPAAQVNYGLKVLDGEGVDRNQALGCAWLAVAAESPRAKGTPMAERLNAQRERAWAALSPADRKTADRLKREIQARIGR